MCVARVHKTWSRLLGHLDHCLQALPATHPSAPPGLCMQFCGCQVPGCSQLLASSALQGFRAPSAGTGLSCLLTCLLAVSTQGSPVCPSTGRHRPESHTGREFCKHLVSEMTSWMGRQTYAQIPHMCFLVAAARQADQLQWGLCPWWCIRDGRDRADLPP